MRLHVVLRYLGLVLVVNGVFLLISAGVSLLYDDQSFRALLYSALVTTLFGVFPMVFVPPTANITKNEGLVIVVGGWILSCLFGTVPYVLWGGEFTFSNAWFESVSGFTTTGSTILNNIEVVPHGLLFWRAATHWIGGLGILLFVLSVLPAMGMANMVIFRSEMSGLAQDTFRRNARQVLRILMTIYLGLTVAETIALWLAGMDLFDAVTHSFATIATGGFSSKNISIAYYNSLTIEIIIMIFMVLSGMHFGLLYAAVVERKSTLWKSSALRYYLGAMAAGIVLMAIITYGAPFRGFGEALRYSAFQALSVGTSTGFANADSAIWPPLAQMLLMFLSLQCACVGSTSGGIKTDRIVMFGKAVRKQVRQLLHPRAVIRAWIDGKSVADGVLAEGILYSGVYLVVVTAGGMALTALGVDPLASFSGAVAATGNVGPGLASVGSLGNFGGIPALGKWVLSLNMLLGRLEIYGLLMLFTPVIWKSKRSA